MDHFEKTAYNKKKIPQQTHKIVILSNLLWLILEGLQIVLE